MIHPADPTISTPAPPAWECWYLTGPTAAGKTKVGVELALRIGAEIVSLDSMAVYQGMDIGTAKPGVDDRRRVPHYLLDVVPPSQDYSLSEYIAAAQQRIAEIRSRGREVLFVGGTPLYLKSLLRGVDSGPPADWEFRRQIDRELETLPLAALHERLQVIDPLLAAKLHPNDKRRIVRGLEVYRLTGQRLSHLQTQFDESRPATQCKVFVLSWPREELHRRIDARVETMFAAGLVDEVRQLLATYGPLSRTAVQAVGYREVMEYLEGTGDRSQGTGDRSRESGDRSRESGVGSRESNDLGIPVLGTQYSVPSTQSSNPKSEIRNPKSLPNCIDRVKARTRQFARRQETWFRSLSECRFLDMREEFLPAEVAEMILQSAAHEPEASARDSNTSPKR